MAQLMDDLAVSKRAAQRAVRVRSARPGRLIFVALLLLAPTLLGACGGDDDEGSGPEAVTIGLTFVPNIQFAPFYVADALGYYEEAGLEVEFNHHAVGADQFGALVAGQEDLLMASGDEVIQVRAREVEVVYVAVIYRKYPVALVVPADSDIQTVADIQGKKVGVPGEYGANWIGLLALLDAVQLTRDDIAVESVGFTQATALLAGHVDAVMGYVNNEPIQIESAGTPVRTFAVSDVSPLVANGLVVTDEYLDDNPDTVRAMVAATLRGLQYALDNPEETVQIAKDYVPTLTDAEQEASALEVLLATLPLWQVESGGELGGGDPADWEAMEAFLHSHGLLENEVDVDDVFNLDYLPED
jgi:NitT/TauT family transport system substrate-binding protein